MRRIVPEGYPAFTGNVTVYALPPMLGALNDMKKCVPYRERERERE